jgi:predicted nucleic acid-binding protein
LEIEKLRAFLKRHSFIALDTPVFIYQMQAHPRYFACTDYIFGWLERSGAKALTSTITMTDLLVQPYRNDDEKAADKFRGLLSTHPNLTWVAPDLDIAVTAARIRAIHRLHTPDALQAATAQMLATGLITNDPIFERVKSFETLTLDAIL